MAERSGAVTMKGNPMTLTGNPIAAGDKAPAFKLLATDLSEKTRADYAGKVLIVVTVPSLDTSVCDTEARKFNEQAASLGDGIAVLVVSEDTPFAQKRWCGAAGIENVATLSDHRDRTFGESYGLMIKELGVLARAVMIIDKNDKITYCELVKEVTQEPDYQAALDAAKQAV